MFPQLFAGTSPTPKLSRPPPSLAPAEQNQMPTCGRRQRAGSVPGPLSRPGPLPETPDAMDSKESSPSPQPQWHQALVCISLSVFPKPKEPIKPCSLWSYARYGQASRKVILANSFTDEKPGTLRSHGPQPTNSAPSDLRHPNGTTLLPTPDPSLTSWTAQVSLVSQEVSWLDSFYPTTWIQI